MKKKKVSRWINIHTSPNTPPPFKEKGGDEGKEAYHQPTPIINILLLTPLLFQHHTAIQSSTSNGIFATASGESYR